MRIDKFLNSVNLTKRRSVAQDMIASGVVGINGKIVKPSKDVAVGDIVSIAFLSGEKKYQVLSLPTIKSTPKSEQDKYIKEVA
ncbi:MAG: RNA-binding S4 domain-containing protein [Thiovulaceae bacterium]|nr:RNA-binding S4 domain-containing protein [Sulfurimonadaceae bacterium]